jgi:hypothetical protein
MRTAGLTLCSLLALAAVVAGTSGCASQHTNAPTSLTGPGAVARTRGSSTHEPPPRSSTAQAVVRAFASSYGRYLDGRLSAKALGNATATVQAQVGTPIPLDSRAGTLAVGYIRGSSYANRFTVGYRDRAHSYSAQLEVAQQGGRWQVTQVVAPDLDSILRRSRAIPLSPGSDAAAATARRFLDGYLPWLYGHARATAIHAASRQLIEQLKAHPPRVPATLRQVHSRLIALGSQRASGAWLALANITAGQQTYQLTVTVARSRGGWRVTKVNAPF